MNSQISMANTFPLRFNYPMILSQSFPQPFAWNIHLRQVALNLMTLQRLQATTNCDSHTTTTTSKDINITNEVCI